MGISQKLAQSKMFTNGHLQEWMHAKLILKNLTKILKMGRQWFQPWVSLNGLSVIYLLCLNIKNQRWLFTFGQTPNFATEKIDHRSTKNSNYYYWIWKSFKFEISHSLEKWICAKLIRSGHLQYLIHLRINPRKLFIMNINTAWLHKFFYML